MELLGYVIAFATLFGVPYYFVYKKLIKGKPHELQKSIIWIIVLALLSAYIVASVFFLPLMHHR
jgi:hypothetical protein